MKKILNILVLGALMACLVPVNAQNFTQPRDPAIQSQKIMTTGATYNGTVYEPFNNTTPAEYNSVGAQAPSHTTSGPRKSGNFNNPTEYGQGPSPIGDAVLPMMLMAMLFAGVVALRRRKEQA